MFGDSLFAFTPFAESVLEPYSGKAWNIQCIMPDAWDAVDKSTNTWDEQVVSNTEWSLPLKNKIPVRRCNDAT